MNRSSQPTSVKIRDEYIAKAVEWVCQRLAFTVDRGNMNPRNVSERMDDGVMGEIASAAVMQFLADNGRKVLAYDQIRQDDYKKPDPGWDIISSRQPFDDWLKSTNDYMIKPDFAFSFSIKSSRIPQADHDDINISIKRRDFKIFKKSSLIEFDLSADFEVQVYFSLKDSKYEDSLIIEQSDITNKRFDVIIEKLKLTNRYSQCFLSGAASKKVLISHSNSLEPNRRYWTSNHAGYRKEMWVAPLSLGTSFENILR